ncbi:MAG: ADP-ribose pyrophosphatase [Sulfurimonas sp.]|jgi:ADP-ribose pyrophosphatase
MLKTEKENVVFISKYIEVQNNDVVDTNTKNKFKHIKLIENNTINPGSVVLCKYNDKFLLLENYRYGINDFSLELPRGYKNLNESLEDCARRELKEETDISYNLNMDSIHKLGEIAVNSAILASKVSFFLITINQSINNLQLQSDEHIISYSWIDMNTLLDYVKNGKIIDSFTINALMLYKLKSDCL